MIPHPRSRTRSLLAFLATLALSVPGCQSSTPSIAPSGVVPAASAARYEPVRDLGSLYHDVQMAALFPDSKTFADARTLRAPSEIAARYAVEKRGAGFNLRAFVDQHFDQPRAAGEGFHTDTTHSMEAHIRTLWRALTRTADAPSPYSSLIPLPNPYVVPGGRFREVYYWDSYFTMLGLVESGRTDLLRSMLDNFAHLIRTVGHVPNGNRTYYLGRSQPPYFAAMVGLYARAADSTQALRYLDALEAEHGFWMDGANRVATGAAYRRVVRLRDGTVLNRYFDDIPEPRPESYREDYTLAQTVPAAQRVALYRNLRASAESGWDFSSRWMRDTTDLRTLETIELLPVDLNSLLYHAEQTIAALRRRRGRAGDAEVAARFAGAAANRRGALLAAAYDPERGFFYDVRWRTGERVTDRPTLAAAAPLYFGLATLAQGRAVAARLERDFLKPGGFVTTLIASGQQWDAPNGWPPLQWLSIEGVRRYGRGDVADLARGRWLALNRRTYRSTGKMTEKYDVVDLNRRAGGGEYPTQDGFGWSNGVALALAAQERDARARRGVRARGEDEQVLPALALPISSSPPRATRAAVSRSPRPSPLTSARTPKRERRLHRARPSVQGTPRSLEIPSSSRKLERIVAAGPAGTSLAGGRMSPAAHGSVRLDRMERPDGLDQRYRAAGRLEIQVHREALRELFVRPARGGSPAGGFPFQRSNSGVSDRWKPARRSPR